MERALLPQVRSLVFRVGDRRLALDEWRLQNECGGGGSH